MAVKSKRIVLYKASKMRKVNSESKKLLERFKIDMAIRDLSENTQKEYTYTLQQWLIFIYEYQDNRSVLEIDDEDLTEYLYFCKSQGNNTCRMKLRISVLSSFYKFLRKKKYLNSNPVEFIERPKKAEPVYTQTFLTKEQIAFMREALIRQGDTQLRLFVMLSLSTMARRSALASLQWNQVDFQESTIHDVPEKEGKIVDLYFNDEVKYLLKTLREEREAKNLNDKGWIFYSKFCKEDKHISPATLNAWCKKVGELIDIPSLHPHDFRHSGATLLKNAGMSLEDVSVLLNHESVETTRKFYIKHDKKRISEVKNRINF